MSSHASREKAFEIFVKRQITSIQKEAWGRSKEVKDIREACQAFLNRFEETGGSEDALRGVLVPLQLACASSMSKIVDLALGCLHKLVAHAWLHGESTPAGSIDLLSATGSVDGDDTVAQVVRMVIKCGETTNEAQQLAVVRALLTFTTAEHFIAHGECLLAAVRTVFNLALSADEPANRRTAANALLQILNTIAKRVTQIQPRFTPSEAGSNPSRTTSDAMDIVRSSSHQSLGTAAGGAATPLAAGMMSPRPSLEALALRPGGAPIAIGGYNPGPDTPDMAGRTAQFASLAAQRDLRGLEAALEASAPPPADQDEGGALEDDPQLEVVRGGVHARMGSLNTPLSPSTSGVLAAVAEMSDEAECGTGEGEETAVASAMELPQLQVRLSPSVVAQTAARHARHTGKLTTNEKDVLLVLTAFCKLASREAGGSTTESFLNQGKLLALELLSKVLQNPLHSWDHVREPFCRQLRQPLCLTLLRNCASPDPVAFQLAVRLLSAIMGLPRLRLGLRAELGAFYPLLVLRPLEQESPDPSNLAVALHSIRDIVADPQLLVDLFVNYDCDMQASNLFERTVQCLSRLAQQPLPEADKPQGDKAKADAALQAAVGRQAALQCLLDTIASLDQWAAPIKEAAMRATGDAGSAAPTAGGGAGGGLGGDGGGANGFALSEVERFGAAKTAKDQVARAVAAFNSASNPLRVVEALIGEGVIDNSPAAVAAFLRQSAPGLSKVQLGELFGHHSDFAVAVMHAWIDCERYGGASIDSALRMLLEQFRLPGEAQKIDRIMEKFAERYCRDNPDSFRSADAAYMLAFAIIMLNTDAHNPLAERRLAKGDFVAMCVQQMEGGMEPVLPQAEVEGIYDRIVAQEIVVRGDAPAGAAGGAAGGAPSVGAAKAQSQRTRLAAALGWSQLLRPLRALGSWDKARGASAERRVILELAEKTVARGMITGNVWHSAQHVEHVRPMLQITGRQLLEALAGAYHAAPDVQHAEALLQGVLYEARLAALLGLDNLCERCVAVLAGASGVFQPAEPGSAAEGKQLAALQALLLLPLGPEASLLGSSWVLVLRCLSALEALQADLTRPQAGDGPTADPPPPAPSNPLVRMMAVFGRTAVAPAPPALAPKAPSTDDSDGGNGLGPSIRAHQSLDSSGGRGPGQVRLAPGAALVVWAEGDGRHALERVYARSGSLDGEAVVVFMRALCAISQEELEAGQPRLFSLHKVVEAAYANMGRIRLVWSKLWAVIAAQLVGASCHPSERVALHAVDALKQLVAKLLARSELANFTYQEEALRPFVAVLRQCDTVGVRELAVQCVMMAAAAHQRDLGSGWRMVVEALRAGVADASPAVMAQSQEALHTVVDALYRPDGGHACLTETIRAILAGVSNPVHLELSISAVALLQRCGDRLAEWEEAGCPGARPGEAEDSTYGWGVLLRTLADILQHERRPRLVNTAIEALFLLVGAHSARWDERGWRVLLQRVLPHMFVLPATSGGGGGAGASGEEEEDAQLLGTYLDRMQRYFQPLCEQASQVNERYQMELVRQLGAISLAWYQHPSEPLATAGLEAFQRMAASVAQRPEPAARDLLLSQLQGAVSDQLGALVAMAARLGERQAAAAEAAAADAAERAWRSGTGGGGDAEPRPPGSPFGNRLLQEAAFRRSQAGGGGSSPRSPSARAAAAAAAHSDSGGGGLYGSPPTGATLLPPPPLSKPALARLQDPLALEAAHFRVRARLMVLLQRAVAALHRQCVSGPGAELQLKLLEVLSTTVDAAVAANLALSGSGDGAAAAAAADADSGEPEPAGDGGTAALALRQQLTNVSTASSLSVTGLVEMGRARSVSGGSGGRSVSREDASLDGGANGGFAVRSIQEDGEASPGGEAEGAGGGVVFGTAPLGEAFSPAGVADAPGSSAQRGAALLGGGPTKGGGGRMPQLVVSSAESVEVVAPALMRLEVEGGMLLVQGLQLSLERGALDAASRGAAQDKLHRLCREVIEAEALASCGADDSNPLRDGLCGVSWQHAVRAPLVVRSLDVLASLQADEFSAEAVGMFASLARLACSNQLSVRLALYRLLSGPQFRALLQASAAQPPAT